MLIEEKLQTEITGQYDVAVCGGGFAGISAALASARMGKKTVLFEKQYMLGGLATAGLITIYLPLCDGMGHQVSFGIAEELFKLSISLGAEAEYPANWLDGIGTKTEKDQRYRVRYNAQNFAILAEKLLAEEGVDIIYGAYAVGTQVEKDKISHIIIEGKSGRQAYKVKSVVDATGDCDIAKLADAPTDTFKEGNKLASWYYSTGKNGYNLNQLGILDIADEEITKDNREVILSNRRFTGLDTKEISEMVCMSHQTLYANVVKNRKEDDTFFPVTMATVPQIRMTRKIVGEYELSHTETHKYFEDSIGMVSDWKKRGPIYEVPFRTLYSKKIKNLICAGRCISTNETLWDIMRVIPCCAVTGQAAGTAAAMTDDFTTLDVKLLQNQLVKYGVKLHENEIL